MPPTAGTGGAPPGMPQPGGGDIPMLTPPPPATLFDIKVKRCIKSGEIKIATVPPEDFLTDPNATEVHEDKGTFFADVSRMTRSDAKLRWPKKKTLIDELPTYTEEDIVKSARNKPWVVSQTDKSSEEIQVFECYIKCDYDGSGIASWWQVCIGGIAGGRKILSIEEWGGDLPYVSITPDPMPHRYRGRSVYDEVGDIQRVKSVLLRQLLDNTYIVDNPMLAANASSIENKDALLEPKVGQVIWTNGPPGDAMVPVGIPYIGDKIFPSLEYFDMVIEKRTGVSRSTMALDLDTLQHQTATAVNAQQSAAFTKVETYARNISECGGFKELFSKLLKLFVQNQKSVKHIKSGGQWIALDPRGWKADMKVTINVGLGAGSRDRDMAMLGGIAQKQEQAIQAMGSPFNPVLNVGHLFSTYQKMVETGGLKSPEQFFPDFSQAEVQQLGQQFSQGQPPPPEMIKMQIEQQKMQADQQMRQLELAAEQQRDQNRAVLDQRAFEQKAQIEATQAQADTATTQAKAQADIETSRMKAEADITTNREKMALETQMEERRFELEKQLKLMEYSLKVGLEKAKLISSSGKTTTDPETGASTGPDPGAIQAAMSQLDNITYSMPTQEQRTGPDRMPEMMSQLAQALQQLAAAHAAPTQVIRGPDGRVVGAQKRI